MNIAFPFYNDAIKTLNELVSEVFLQEKSIPLSMNERYRTIKNVRSIYTFMCPRGNV